MADFFDVTSANVQIILACEDLYTSGVKLEGFSADSVMTADGVDQSENRRGVDGRMVSGVVKNIQPVSIVLEANSPSLEVFETIRDAMSANCKPYELTLTVFVPALEKTIVFRRGALKNGPNLPSVQKTLQPTTWTMEFQEVA